VSVILLVLCAFISMYFVPAENHCSDSDDDDW